MTRHVNQQLRARRQHELTNIVKQYRERITQFENETESIRAVEYLLKTYVVNQFSSRVVWTAIF